MKSIRRIISSILCVVLILTAAPLSGFVGLELPNFSGLFSTKADAESYNGACGDNLKWSLDATTGEFVVSGTGNMVDYDGIECTPWWDYCSLIKKVTIDSGVTGIGANAFAFCTAIADVEIKDANVVLENNAFYNCSNLTNISFGSGEVSIGDYAFAECTSLVNVYLPESIKMINECAFGGCVSLEKITIPKSITVIPDFLFYNCTNLNTIVLQNNIKRIESSAFYNCVNLSNAYFCGSQEEWEKVSVYPGNEDLLNNIKYDYVITSGVCGDDLVWKLNLETGSLVISGNGKMYDYSSESGFMHPWNAEFVKSVSFSGNVTGIGSYAFYKCVNLMEIIIPDSVNVIGVSAFNYCASLKSATIGNGINYIEDIFYGCESLSSVNIGSGVTGFDSDLFSGCLCLENITVNSQNNYYSGDDYGVLFNRDKTELIQYPKGNKRTSYIIPETVRVIGDSAFSNSDNLTSIEIPNSVTDVGEEALAACDRLISVIIGTGVTRISDYVFYNCPNLENISIGNGVKEIGEEAFYYCTNLESVDIPDSVTVIGARAFMDCHSLKSVSVGNSVEVIEAGAFANCNSLKNVSLGNSVEIIGNGAFFGCSSLTDIVIPESVTMIKDAAFCFCQNLSNISIPQTDILIGEEAFIYTEYYGDPLEWPKDEMGMQLYIGNHLIKVYIGKRDFVVNEGTRTIASGTFRGTGFVSVSTPDNVTLIGDGAFAEMYNLTTVKLGNGIKRIGSSVFKDSTNLTEVYMGKEAEGFSVAEDALDGFTGRIYGYADSYMQTFAESRGIEFVAYDIVELNYNGFGDGVDHLRAAGGKILSDIPNVFSESKTFTGWYDTPDGGTLYTAESVVNEDITLYANWTDRKIQKQTVITPPAKTSYFVGDEFVLDGYKVEIEYDNGFTKTYNKDNLTVLNSTLTEAGEQTVSVQADEFVIEIPVEVIPIKASSISISKLPVKTEYVTGQKIDTTGLELKVVNNNGTTEYVTDGFELVDDAVYSVGINDVLVTYQGITTSFQVNVAEILPDTLSVSKLPDKTFYSLDEDFESKGLELTVTYNNGTTKVLSSLSDVNIEYDFSSMNPTVTFSYTERGKMLTCTLDIVVYESPEISLENVSVEAGGTVGIPVHIIGNCGLMGFKFQMTYNADIFVPQSITWILDSGNKEDNIGSNPSGAVDIVWSGDENYNSDGLLFTVNFNVADNTVGDFDFGISYSSDNVYNEEEELVKLSCTGSTINVVKPSLPDVMTIYIDPVSTENGTQIDVPVNLHKNTGLGVSVINIVYDSNALTPVSVTSGMSTVLSENVSSANGNLQIILLATDAGLGDGTLFNIKFDVSDNAAGEYPLTLSCVGQTTQNGLITVNNASLSENTKIYADDVIANNGKTVRIPVYISNNHGVMGMNIRFRFDPDILRPINVTKGNALTSGTFDSGILTDENMIVISWFDSSDFNGNGEIAILEFEVLAEGVLGSFIEVTYSQDDTFNEKWEDVILDCSNINVVVTSDLLAAKPGTTTIIESGLIYGLDCGLNNLDDYVVVDNSYNLDYNGNTVLGTGSVVSAMLNGNNVQDYNIVIFGDVNGDGWCDGMDAVIVSCLADGMLTKNDVGEAVYMAADCNFDGTIDSADVELLQEAGLKQNDISQTGKTKVVTISLNANGGSVSGKTVTAYVGNTVGTLPVPTREHYTFVGWFTAVSGGTEVKSTTILSEANDVTLYARWSPVTYRVELNANGGSCSTDSETVAYDSIYGTLPIPTKTGYTFNGWYTAVSGGTKITEDTKVTAASNHTLYAQWSVNSYKIDFNGNGSTGGSMSKLEMKYGTAKKLTANAFAKTGYSFNGWNTNSDGSGTSYADKASVNNLTSTNGVTVTLYAQWNANTGTKYVVNHYQMNVSGSGYTLKETENKTGTTASSVTIANLKKTYAGFTYEGGMGTTSATAIKPSTLDTTTTVLADGTRVINIYYSRNKFTLTLNKGTGITAVSGAGTYYYGQSVTIDATVAIGYTWSKWSDNNATKKVAITMPANALALTANATLNSYTINYTLNGGTVATANPTSYNVTTADFTLNNPTRTGYTFAGWTGTGLSAATKTVTVAKGSTGNRSYTATWTANTYIVTFDANGGSCSTASKSVTYDSTYGTLPTPTRTGYTFTGWYTASSSGTKITADTKVTVTANQKLYAQWTANGYTIVFNGNGATSGSMTNLAMTYGTSKNLTANAFAKTNYSFNGWNTKADGSGTSYADKASINNLTSTNGATVTLYATWKLKTVSMPSYIGWYYTDAQTNLKNLGLNVTFNYAYNYNYAYGVVYAQNYNQGTTLNAGTTVVLTYSLGAKPYAVGDYVYFDGGPIYKNLDGTAPTYKPGSDTDGLFIITDLTRRYNGTNYYGVKYQGTPGRYGWVAENLIHQMTN